MYDNSPDQTGHADGGHDPLATVRNPDGTKNWIAIGKIVCDKSWRRPLSPEDQAVWDHFAKNGGGWTLKRAGDAYDEHQIEQQRQKLRKTGGQLVTVRHEFRNGRQVVTRTVERFAASTRRPCSRVPARSRERRASRRAGASSSTSSSDPGSDSDGGDGPSPAARPSLTIARTSARCTFACLSLAEAVSA